MSESRTPWLCSGHRPANALTLIHQAESQPPFEIHTEHASFGIDVAVRQNPASFCMAFGQLLLPYGRERACPGQSARTDVGNRPRPAKSQHCPPGVRSSRYFPRFRTAANPVELWNVFDASVLTTNGGFYSEGSP